MSLLRFIGLGEAREETATGDTATVRRIAAKLEHLDPETAKYLAAFAYVLARMAHADLEIDDAETQAMERAVRGLNSLSEAEATLVVEIAKSQARLLGGTENYVVTREFRRISTRDQRGALLQSLYAVAAADGTISSVESAEIVTIAEELGFTRAEANSLRSQYRDKLAEFQTK
ncbi:MAG: TerB family tellurite resistance protein [Myxococcales bacterium]|nr:TerB family tellurite resistance protein [Myxococcales bacterium]